MKLGFKTQLTLVAGAVFAFAGVAQAQQAGTYPTRPITLIVPVTAGSSIDVVSRAIGSELSKRLGQPVVVDNKPGASGNIGAAIVAKAAPDGYTLMITTSSLGMVPTLMKTLPWDPRTAFTPVAGLFSGAMSLAVGNHVPAKNIEELVALAKKEPGKLTYASPGPGTPHHFGTELLQQNTGTKMLHVPYKGTGGAIVDLIAGRIDVAYFSAGNLLSHHKAGKVRILATSTDARLEQASDIPTMRELGYRNSELNVWAGMFAPAGTPAAIVSRLSRELSEVMKSAPVKAIMEAQTVAPIVPGTAEHLAAEYKADLDRWPGVAARAGISAE